MAKTKYTAKDLREKDPAALRQDLAARRRAMFDLRVQSVTEKVADPTQYGKAKRDIARILTILKQKQTTAAAAAK